jgi:hypothetical protein
MLLAKRLIALLTLLFLPQPGMATWYSEGMERGADLVLMDLRWPWWPSGTYYAHWNTGFKGPNGSCSFYSGFTSTLEDGPGMTPNSSADEQAAFRPGMVWSFWGGDSDGNPVEIIDISPRMALKNEYAGEGTSSSSYSAQWEFVTHGRWYTMASRHWTPENNEKDCSYLGRWIKDIAADQWHLIGVARIPFRSSGMEKNSGFIETLSGPKVVRPLDRRFGYYRLNGEWKSSNTLSINSTRHVVLSVLPEDDHEYVAIEYASQLGNLPIRLKGEPIPGKGKTEVTARQPKLPALDQPVLGSVNGQHCRDQVSLSWEMSPDSSPMLGYKIEVFDNPSCSGDPIETFLRKDPSSRHAIFTTTVDAPTIRFSVADIFDQWTSGEVIANLGKRKLIDGMRKAETIEGLSFEIFSPKEKNEKSWSRLGHLDSGRRHRQGLSRGADLSVLDGRKGWYGIVFDGFLNVPADGAYLFYGLIDGAYKIEVGGQTIIRRNDQAGTRQQEGVAFLEAGLQSVRITSLVGDPGRPILARNFRLFWEGPGFSRQEIPVGRFSSTRRANDPIPSLIQKTAPPGTVDLTLETEANGHKIRKVSLNLGRFEIANSTDEKLVYQGALPATENRLWTRIQYDAHHSIDLNLPPVSPKIPPSSEDWTVRNLGEQEVDFGLYETAKGSFSFFGEGMHAAIERIEGDFTATVRVDRFAGSDGEPVNEAAWIGLGAWQDTQKLNWNWGETFYLARTARKGIRTSPDSRDLGGSRMNSYKIDREHPWLRICRQGQQYTAWTSADGNSWQLAATHLLTQSKAMDVGLFIRAIQQNAQSYFSCEVSNLSLQSGVPRKNQLPAPPIAAGTSGQRITGMVMARSDPNVVVVRGTHLGLVRSIDEGRSWNSANGSLKGSANAVRSVAIHPTNPDIMIRAAGWESNGTWTGGLWRTNNGGRSWGKLNFPGDFDGKGPSALCGEVVAFDLRNPDRVYAGTESKGFYQSLDSGRTWALMDLVGERITSVTVWGWEYLVPEKADDQSHLGLTTCPDSQLVFLGRGEPAIPTKSTTSKVFLSTNDCTNLKRVVSHPYVGLTRLCFGRVRPNPDEYRVASTHGIFHNWGGPIAAYPPERHVEWMKPFTALDDVAMPPDKDQRMGRMMTASLAPERHGILSISEGGWWQDWKPVQTKGDSPEGGLIGICGEHETGETWWVLTTRGLYRSGDGGLSFKQILDASGSPVEGLEGR